MIQTVRVGLAVVARMEAEIAAVVERLMDLVMVMMVEPLVD